MAVDSPIIAYDNLLDGSSGYTIIDGSDGLGAPFSNSYNRDILSPAIPTTDSLGAFTIDIDMPSSTAAEVFIMGAHRRESAGFKATGGNVALWYWNGTGWVTAIGTTPITAQNVSTIYKLPAHTLGLNGAVYQYKLTYTSITSISSIFIPELFLGTMLEMKSPDVGYDPYNNVFSGSKFSSLSGRTYKNLHYNRLELKPKWTVLERSVYDAKIADFRELALEPMRSMWWAWMPDTLPNECYLMIHDGNTRPYPIKSVVHRSFALDLIEDV